MQAFGLTKMQLLKIVFLLSVFVLSPVLAIGNYGLLGHFLYQAFFDVHVLSKVLIQEQINFLPEPVL